MRFSMFLTCYTICLSFLCLTQAPLFNAFRVCFQKHPPKTLHNDKLLNHEENGVMLEPTNIY